jgi:PrtD family type I secretion system ABC transporter
MSTANRHTEKGPLVSQALKGLRGVAGTAFLVSAVINLLALSGSLFMLQVYDRVLPAQSLSTLVALLVLLVALYILQGGFDLLRSRLLVRVGEVVDAKLARPVFVAIQRTSLGKQSKGDGLQSLRDLDQLRSFAAGSAPVAMFDLPWMPLFVILTFMLHPLLGFVTVAGAVVLLILMMLTEVLTARLSRRSVEEMSARNATIETARRSAETMETMGLSERLEERWIGRHRAYKRTALRSSDIAAATGAVGKVWRQLQQSLVLAVGAYLVVKGEATGGVMFAASILAGRALAPIDQAIAHWKSFQAARQAIGRLNVVLKDATTSDIELCRPTQSLVVSSLTVAAPGARTPSIAGIDFELKAGQALGVVGPSASGKSSLVRGLLGIWPTVHGEARLDGATLDQWSPASRGDFIGYLPQTIELYDGTIAENIARFDPQATSEDIIAAAKAAAVHEMIVRLPKGYETEIGEGGAQLSVGQRQRVALARALYGKPFLIVLDEPNAALDSEGEVALNRSIRAAKMSGAIVIVLAHRPSVLAEVDRMLVIKDGRQVMCGARDEVLRKIQARPEQQIKPMAPVENAAPAVPAVTAA